MIELPRGERDWNIAAGATLDPAEIFGREAPLTVEIGSGQGHVIVNAARENPDRDFLAIEVFQAGLARTMLRAEWADVANLRLVEANAPELLERVLPASSVSELWVYFPDPWPKKKQQKRRLVSPEFLKLAARVLVPGGVLRLATDWEEYALHMRDVCDASPDFTRDFSTEPDAWAPRSADRVVTAFEQKGLKHERLIRDLAYRRR